MSTKIDKQREREKKMVSQMIQLYCKKQHHSKDGLCPECAALDAYARMRSEKCPFMEAKTFCPTARCTAISRKWGKRSVKSCVSPVQGCCFIIP